MGAGVRADHILPEPGTTAASGCMSRAGHADGTRGLDQPSPPPAPVDPATSAIAAALGAAAAGRGQLMVVEGPAGLGKTWLLKAALEDARARGFKTLTARASELEREFAFGLVRQLLEPAVANAGEQRWEALFRGGAARAQPLFQTDPAGAAPAVAASCAVLHALYRLLSHVADGDPLLITVDDVHWADPHSLRFLVLLLSRLEELPLVLLVALGHGESAESPLVAQIASASSAIALRPRPLSRGQVAELVVRTLARGPAPEFTDECHAATAGNPFLLGALLQEVATRGIAPTESGARHVRALGPPTVWHATRMRIARVPHGAALARAVALLGDGADLRHAAALAGLEEHAATKAADLLTRASILRRTRQLEFVHPIVRRAIYADLPPQERAAGHARAAKLVATTASPEQIAAHLLETSPGGDQHVVQQLRSAAEEALGRGETNAAIRFLRRALDEPPDPALRVDILVALGSARYCLGERAGVDHLREAFELADDPRRRALVARELAVVLGMSGRHGDALALLTDAINSLPLEDRELSLELEADLAAISKRGTGVAAVARARLTSLRPSIAGDTAAERRLLAEVAWHDALQGARADEVATVAERALRTPRWVLGGLGGAPQYFLASYLLVRAERFDAADSYLRQAVAEARATGSAITHAAAAVQRSALAYRRGDVREAQTQAAAAVDLQRRHGWALGPANALAQLIDALIELGEIEQAERVLEQHEHGRHIPDDITFNDLLESRGALRLAQGRTGEALADFREYGRRERDWRASNPAFSAWRSRAAIAHSALGEHGEARRLVARELALARAFGAPRAIGIALRAHGLLEKGEAQLALLAEAVSMLERSSARLEHARALVDLGAATRRRGRRRDAREPLRRGLELADSCGAIALVERAREELDAIGDRPRRVAAGGSDALTPRESHVAQMAADGLSNPQIAQALFVSLKTVETHLGHVYRKLDIRSRAELKTTLPGAA